MRVPGWLARAAHVGYGLAAGLLGGCDMVALTLAFLGYEYMQSLRLGDAGYRETLEYAVGLLLGTLARLVRGLYAP